MRKHFFSFIRAIIIVGIIIHFTIKDYVLITAIIFYALPLPLLILMTLFLAAFTKNISLKSSLIAAVILIFIWIKQSYVSNTISNGEEGFEIVFWNASHDRGFEESFIEIGNIPDVLVLVESQSDDIEIMRLEYPDYSFYSTKEEIAVFSKTPLFIESKKKGEDNSKLLNFRTNNFNFYVVDVSAGIFKPRQKSMSFVNSNILERHKTIVLGDFNTPYESRYFQFFKKNFVNAFDEKGNGFRETWFWNIPLLSLDHIWTSKDLNILQIEKANTFKSDHAMLKMRLSKDTF